MGVVTTAPAAHVCATFRAVAYARWSRVVAAWLVAFSRVSLPLLLLAVVRSVDPPITPLLLLREFLVLVVLPAAGAWLLARAHAADVEVYERELVVRRRGGGRVEVPVDAIAAVVPWRVPIPGPGVGFRMRSGRRFRWGVQLADPGALVGALAEVAGSDAARAAATHPLLVYARARPQTRRWYRHIAKFPLFALVPTAIAFNAEQHISYGGLFGEYYQLGLGSYLRTFAVLWVTVTIYLVLFASVWRGAAEAVCLAAAAVAPSWATRVRRLAEIACTAGYYLGVPALLALRFLS